MDLPGFPVLSVVAVCWPRAANAPAIDVQAIVSKAPNITAADSPEASRCFSVPIVTAATEFFKVDESSGC